jgi:hypothetical protein
MVHESSKGSGSRPQEKAESQDPVHVEAIHQPAGNGLEHGVGPEESRKQKSELRGGEAKFVFEGRRRDGEIAAVNVVDEHRDPEQEKDDKAGAGESGSGRGDGSQGTTLSDAGTGIARAFCFSTRQRKRPR